MGSLTIVFNMEQQKESGQMNSSLMLDTVSLLSTSSLTWGPHIMCPIITMIQLPLSVPRRPCVHTPSQHAHLSCPEPLFPSWYTRFSSGYWSGLKLFFPVFPTQWIAHIFWAFPVCYIQAFKNLIYVCILYMSALPACMTRCQKRAPDPIIDGCELPCGCRVLDS